MRRVAWAVLTGLGVFFIMLAVLSRFFVPAQAVKFPLNEYTKTTLQANNASYFSSKSVTPCGRLDPRRRQFAGLRPQDGRSRAVERQHGRR